jgi:hypothetical protein
MGDTTDQGESGNTGSPATGNETVRLLLNLAAGRPQTVLPSNSESAETTGMHTCDSASSLDLCKARR